MNISGVSKMRFKPRPLFDLMKSTSTERQMISPILAAWQNFLSDGSMLDFKEFVAAARERIEKYKYAYNYRRQDQFVFRYDNAPDPRARNLPSFPHHVHLSSGKIARSLPKDICGILDCIENSMIEAAGIEPPALNGV
jgi:hypothetical protein